MLLAMLLQPAFHPHRHLKRLGLTHQQHPKRATRPSPRELGVMFKSLQSMSKKSHDVTAILGTQLNNARRAELDFHCALSP